MGLISDIFGSRKGTKTSSTKDPWAPAIPYLTEALGTGKGIFDQYSDLSPEEGDARQQQIDLLKGRQGNGVYEGGQDVGATILGGGYDPKLQKTYGVAPSLVGYDMGTANPTGARAKQGVLDPTQAYQSLLSGQVDNPQLARMAEAATRGQQRAYGDALQDSDQSLTRSVLPAIRSGAVSSGGYGGSRQGIAEGLALSDRNKGLDRAARDLGIASGDATASLFGNAYEAAQGRKAGAASELDSRAQQARQFDAGNAFDARKLNAAADQGAQQFNVNNVNTQNAQELAAAGLKTDIAGKGLDIYQDASAGQDDDFGQLMSVLGLPRSMKQDAFSNYIQPLLGIGASGGQSKGKSVSTSRDSLFNIGQQLAAMLAGAPVGPIGTG